MNKEIYGTKIIRSYETAISIAERIMDNLPFEDAINGRLHYKIYYNDGKYIFYRKFGEINSTSEFYERKAMFDILKDFIFRMRLEINQDIRENQDVEIRSANNVRD